MDDDRLADYYERRAPSYDEVYHKIERQDDLRELRQRLPPLVAGRDVLEVASGTGYWTEVIATTAKSVCATDLNAAPLHIAAKRSYPRRNVQFVQLDAFALGQLTDDFDAAFVGFWWSHLRLDQTDQFLRELSDRLTAGSPVIMVDNRYVEGSNMPVTRTDEEGNTYQQRWLPDGTGAEILKNFPTPAALLAAVEPYGTLTKVTELEYYWVLTFQTR